MFATSIVPCVGAVIGVVVAETQALAQRAARLVAVVYEDLPSVMSCEEALAAGGPFYDAYGGVLACGGDVEAALAGCEHVRAGDLRIGGQEHFYLEPHTCFAQPTEGGREMLLVASTQAPSKHQATVAAVLGLPRARVVCKTKRIGGGFGGKETRSVFLHAAAAVPAHLLQRPVRLCLDRDEDMQMTGAVGERG